MVLDISTKLDFLKALETTKNLEQLIIDFPRLTELEIKTVLKQLKDDGFVRVLPPLPGSVMTDNPRADEFFSINGRLDEVEQELYKRGIQSRTKGVCKQSESLKRT